MFPVTALHRLHLHFIVLFQLFNCNRIRFTLRYTGISRAQMGHYHRYWRPSNPQCPYGNALRPLRMSEKIVARSKTGPRHKSPCFRQKKCAHKNVITPRAVWLAVYCALCHPLISWRKSKNPDFLECALSNNVKIPTPFISQSTNLCGYRMQTHPAYTADTTEVMHSAAPTSGIKNNLIPNHDETNKGNKI